MSVSHVAHLGGQLRPPSGDLCVPLSILQSAALPPRIDAGCRISQFGGCATLPLGRSDALLQRGCLCRSGLERFQAACVRLPSFG